MLDYNIKWIDFQTHSAILPSLSQQSERLFSRHTNVIFLPYCCLEFAAVSRAAKSLLWVTFKPNWINETDCFGAPRYCYDRGSHTHTYATVTPRGVGYQLSVCSTLHIGRCVFCLIKSCHLDNAQACLVALKEWCYIQLHMRTFMIAVLAVATGLCERQASHWLKLHSW